MEIVEPAGESSMELGEWLKYSRLRMGWSQEQAARRFDVSLNTYGSWERGQYKPRYDLLLRIIALFGTPPPPRPKNADNRRYARNAQFALARSAQQGSGIPRKPRRTSLRVVSQGRKK